MPDSKEDILKRQSYLLKQCEIFAHFGCSEAKRKKSRKSSGDYKELSSQEKTARHRKTEAEEDEELLKSNSQTDKNKNYPTIFNKSPHFIKKGEMRDYQIRGLNWMINLYENGINGILADEMGLGKTLQTISMLGYLHHFRNISGKHLVLAPKSCVQNWINEFKMWCPSLKAKSLYGDKETRAKFIKNVMLGNGKNDWDVIVCSYELLNIERAQFKKISWKYCIIDEAHRIKNEKSKLSESVRMLTCHKRLLLTGTPLQNNLHELWALLNFLLPDIFSSSDQFDTWFDTNETVSNEDQTMVKKLHAILKPFLLRRVKSEVEKALLPKKELKVQVGLSAMQRSWYSKILMKDIELINQTVGKSAAGKMRMLNILMQLRKCTNHPYLFDGAEPKFNGEYTTDQHLIDNSGKLVVLDRLLKKFKERGDRVLIFSQMTRVLDILEDYCMWQEYKYCRLDGDTDHEQRQADIDTYNAEGSEKFIYMLSTRAGGLGINLMTANIVVIFDSDWNPQADLQAIDRAHRIGQKKQVFVFRLITDNTVEERIMERASMKLALDSLVIQQGRLTDSKSNKLGAGDMLSMIRHGAQSIFASKDSTITDDDIDRILEKAESYTKEKDQKLSKLSEESLQKFSMDFEAPKPPATENGGFSVYNWEGKDWKNKQKEKEDEKENLMQNWIALPKRERKSTVYNIDSYFKEALSSGKPSKEARAPRYRKAPQISTWQFFPPELSDLLEKQMFYYYKQNNQTKKIIEFRDFEDPDIECQIVNECIKKASPLTEGEIQERDRMLKEEGFIGWKKHDFYAFIRACEQYGRTDKQGIIKYMMDYSAKNGDKFDDQEISEYYDVFINRHHEIEDWQRYIKNIEKGEERLRKKRDTRDALKEKVLKYQNPYIQLKINYFAHKNALTRSWTELEDRYMVCMLEKIGYEKPTVYEEIKRNIRVAPQFRFDWFIKSRTSTEISKRCQFLLNLIEKEYREAKYGSTKNNEAGERGKRKADDAGLMQKGPVAKTLKKSSK